MFKIIDFRFEDFAKLCPDVELERFRDHFSSMLDINGAVASYTVGFHFSFDDEDPSCEASFLEMVELFQPVAIWSGNEALLQRVSELGHTSTLFPYFEDGGFMVVLKVPARVPQ